AEDSRGLGVDNELELGGLHDRQIRSLRALDNAADIAAALTPRIQNIGAVAHQAADLRRFPVGKTRRYAMPHRQTDQLDAPAAEKGIAADEERIRPLPRNIPERRVDLPVAAGVLHPNLQSHRTRRFFHLSEYNL